jgi:hypothetical protein
MAQIVVPLAQQLSWSHFIAPLPLKTDLLDRGLGL